MKIKEHEIEPEFYTKKLELQQNYNRYEELINTVLCRKESWKKKWLRYLRIVKKYDFVLPKSRLKEELANEAPDDKEVPKEDHTLHFIKALVRYNLLKWVLTEADTDDKVDSVSIKNVNYFKIIM